MKLRPPQGSLVDQDVGSSSTPIDFLSAFEEFVKDQGFHLDMNVEEDKPCSIKQPCKDHNPLKTREDGRNCRQEERERNPSRVWEEMMRHSHPPRKKHSQSAILPRNVQQQLAKKDQVDRFAKLAAPSGLLKGLNPGIINHVRNQKQVYSIIQALVKSEENRDQPSGRVLGDLMTNRSIRQGCFEERKTSKEKALFTSDTETKQSASMVLENCSSCLSNVESGNAAIGGVASLSFQAAHVASQWLELIIQDIKGRLAALRCSKRRVHSVITTELPSLMSRESMSYLEKNESLTERVPLETHAITWMTLFQQMDDALSEEESHLVSWLLEESS